MYIYIQEVWKANYAMPASQHFKQNSKGNRMPKAAYICGLAYAAGRNLRGNRFVSTVTQRQSALSPPLLLKHPWVF